MNRYIIFDMDGVVIDSEGWYLNLLRNFLSNNNFNIPDKVFYGNNRIRYDTCV